MNGVVCRLVDSKGFGFVKDTKDGGEFFFHRSACVNCRFEDLREGQEVTFTEGKGPKGPRAEHVEVR